MTVNREILFDGATASVHWSLNEERPSPARLACDNLKGRGHYLPVILGQPPVNQFHLKIHFLLFIFLWKPSSSLQSLPDLFLPKLGPLDPPQQT